MSEVVLLLHSSGLSSRQWSSLSEALADRYRVLAPDLLGYGSNPTITDAMPYHFESEVDALLDQLPDAKAHVVGHSFGGMVALMLARRRPQRIVSLSLYDPVTFGVLYDADDSEGLPSFSALDSNPKFRDEATGGDEAWLELFVNYWNAGPAWASLPPSTRAGFMKVGRKVFREVMQVTRDRTPRSAYATIAAPTLLLTGEHTPIAARRTVALLAEALPQARLEMLRGAGHMGPITHAAQVNRAIVEHITRAQLQRTGATQ